MTRSLPNVPLWAREGRSGTRPAAISSSSSVAPAGTGDSGDGLRPKPSDRSVIGRRLDRCVVELAEGLEPAEDPALAVVEPLLDVRREEEPAARGPYAERDRDRVVRFVADRDRDARHPELLRASLRAAVEPDGGLARGEPLDLDVAPADAADTEPEDLRHGLLRGP